jgi:hypothetical protein
VSLAVHLPIYHELPVMQSPCFQQKLCDLMQARTSLEA